MQKFKKMRGVRKAEEVQGLIFYTCLNYRDQPQEIREKIDRLCRQEGRECAEALKELLTTGCSCTYAAMRHNWSENAIYAAKRRFYNAW